MSDKFRKNKITLLIGFGLSLILLITSSVIAYRTVTSLLNSAWWVSHTSEVERGLEKVVSYMKDAETGQRGFLLTGQETFLEPYNIGKDSVWSSFSYVKQLTADNIQQQQTLDTLDIHIHRKLGLLERTIQGRRSGQQIGVSTLDSGKIYMDDIRAVIKVMQRREEQLMRARTGRFEEYSMETPYILAGAGLLSILLTIYFYRRISNHYRERLKLEDELLAKNAKIQQQIATIDRVAKQVSDGNYDVRISKEEME